MNQNETLSSAIPVYTHDDYLTTAPYEFAYQYIEDGFTLERVLTTMSERARQVKITGFRKLFAEYVKKKKAISRAILIDSVTRFEGQPIELSCGDWKADDFGISISTEYGEKSACSHPLLPVTRLVNIDTGVEKLCLAYRKGKQWRYITADKKTLASNNSILELANVGVAVTSENSKYMVQYLHDVETLNYDEIPEKNSVSRLGWIDNAGFSPYVDDLVFDGDLNFKTFFESVKESGSYEKWLDLAREVRSGSVVTTRIILAASFASVLVKPLGGLPFFVHLWGGTESGKTVGLLLAASVWANPEIGRFIHTFNSTAVGREKSAAFVNSMPLILDELQIVKDKKEFDKDIYMLSEGAGRTRGNKGGGVDQTPTWANCILTSGEMPITSSSSGGGAVNRIIEVECQDKLFPDPRRAADTVKKNYGFAGPEFVSRFQESGQAEYAQELFKRFYSSLSENDTTEKQAMSAAMVLTADQLATEWIFQDGNALTAFEISEFLQTKSSVSMNERGYEYLCEFVVSNKNRFCGKSDILDVWGDLEYGQAYIVRNIFNRVCLDAGYNPQALLSWLKQNNKIETNSKGFTKAKRINGEPCNCVVLQLSQEECDDFGLIDDDV